MADAKPSGWAIRRNGTCVVNEVDCGETVDPFRVCCPSGSFCPDQSNKACCPQSGGNCTESLVQTPVCANSSWSLFTSGGYFCCDPDTWAFSETSWVGCAQTGSSLPGGAVLLQAVSTGSAPATSPTSSPGSSGSSPTPPIVTGADSNGATSSRSGGGTNVGAIAGGVVGGVVVGILIVGAIWFWQRRKKSSGPPAIGHPFVEQAPPSYEYGNMYGRYGPEVENKPRKLEMPSNDVRAEFDGTSRTEIGISSPPIMELPATQYGR